AAAVSKISLTAPEKLQAIVIARPSHRASMEVDLKELLTSARGRATVVFYLATAHLKSIVDAITASGYPSSTPATVVYRATWGDQKIVTGTLEDVVEKVEREGIARDYILIVGPPNTPDLRRGAPRSVVYSREKQHQKRQE
ncbi:MAG: SAM-dependent methyltransferase, partial [Ignisphaera sp.]|nr:SAM-dependent methyltransferase [Ignisphaera sp.]